MDRSRSASTGPTPGMSRRSNPSMNSASPPGSTTWTPAGFARSAASFATTRVGPPPMDTVISVSSLTAAWIRRAVSASGSPW